MTSTPSAPTTPTPTTTPTTTPTPATGAASAVTDVVDAEAGVTPGSALDTLRRRRPNAREHSQAAFAALFDAPTSPTFTLAERLAIADFVVRIGSVPVAVYAARLREADRGLASAIAALGARATADGPFGHYPPSALSAEDTDGLRWTPSRADAAALGTRLAAGLAHAHLLVLRPREAASASLAALQDAGWTVDDIVTLSQLVAFLTYQVRIIHSLRVLAGNTGTGITGTDSTTVTPRPDATARATTEPHVPVAFTQDQLWWEPWLPPLAPEELTEAHYDGLVERPRAALPYFRLLARDPAVLRARTLADLDIFTNDDGGLGRAERELAAAATSRLNGCVFCASVHARAASRFSKRRDDVQRLLDDGPDTSLGDERWDAVTAAAVALTTTPVAFDQATVERLRAAGLSDLAVFDTASAAAFFNWANRLMLSIGEPRVNAEKLDVIRTYEATKSA